MTGSGPAAPRISVLLPVYNGARHLRESLDSLLGQTLRDFEVVVVDDGSTDETPAILAEYADRDARFRVVRQETNRGLISTLNHGLEACRAPFVARQDADDASEPGRLERQLGFLEQRPEIGVLATAYVRVSADGVTRPRHPATDHTELRWGLLFENVWCHSTIMLRRDAIPEGELEYRDFLHAEDFELWGRLLQHTRGATLAEPLVRYREHDQAVSVQNEAAQREMVARVSEMRLRELLGRPLAQGQAEALGALWRGRFPADSPSALATLRELFRRFAAEPDVDARLVGDVRARWVRRLLQRSGSRMLSSAAGLAAFGSVMPLVPGAWLRGAMARLRAL